MKLRYMAAVLLAALVQAVAVAVPPEEFNAAVDFNVSIQTLYERMQSDPEGVINSERSVILDGMVASITVIDPSEQSFQAFIELVTGEWQGLSNVELYRTFVVVSGPEYYSRIQTRQNREPSGRVIAQNSRALVAGNVVDFIPDESGTARVPVVVGIHVRTLP